MEGIPVIPQSKAVVIKFCGGCNPTFDRLQYWEQVKAEAGGAIRWVGPDHPDRKAILLICGCHTSCPLKNFHPEDYGHFLLVRDERTAPAEVAKQILE